MKTPLLAFLLALAAAAQHNTLTGAERAEGWRLLFDGRTLSHFHDPRTLDPPGDSWTVEDGCIKAQRRPRIREDLVTRDRFGDFELVWDWKISPRGNSGVKYRIQDFILLIDRLRPPGARFELQVHEASQQRLTRRDIAPDDRSEEYVVGFEYQMIDDAGHPDARSANTHTAGALYDMLAPSAAAARPAGEWNQSRLLVRGDEVEHWLNGQRVVQGSLSDPHVRARIEKRWGVAPAVSAALLGRPARQTPISLQNHNDEAWFRNLKIRALR